MKRPNLTITVDGGENEEFSADSLEGPISIGRDEENDIQVMNPFVSRRHAEVLWSDDHWIFRDLQSTSGSFCMGSAVREVSVGSGVDVHLGRPDGPRIGFSIDRERPKEDASSTQFLHRVRPEQTRYLAALTATSTPAPLDEASAKRLQLLYGLSASLLAEGESDTVPREVVDSLGPLFTDCRIAVLLFSEKIGALQVEAQTEEFEPSRVVSRHVHDDGEAVLSIDAGSDDRFDTSKSIFVQAIRSVMAVPLSTPKRSWGVLYVDTVKRPKGFSEEELDFVAAVARLSAQAMDSRWLATELRATLESMMKTLAASIDAKDYITAGHSNRVAHYTKKTAQYLGLTDDEIRTIYYAALLHDYGKIGIDDAVLKKPGSLTDEEYIHIKQHARYTFDILSRVHFPPDLKDLSFIAATHHERMDGKGYPFGLSGEDVPIGGRIISIVDVYDSLTQKRHYRDPMPEEQVIEILEEGRGTRFDPEVLDAFRRYHTEELLPKRLKKAQRDRERQQSSGASMTQEEDESESD